MPIALRDAVDLAGRTLAATAAAGGGALAAWAFARTGWPTNIPPAEQPMMAAVFVLPVVLAGVCLTAVFRGWSRWAIYGFALLPAAVLVLSIG
jgi:hypothetical protein